MTIQFRDWELTVDKELTKQAYTKARNGGAETCSCDECKNFINYRDKVYPLEIKNLFNDLGIDFRKECEVEHAEKLNNGLHAYSGWFHFQGSFIGETCSKPAEEGKFTFVMTPITEYFSIGFRKESHLTFFPQKENLVQIEFDVKIPWTLDSAWESD